MSALLMQLVQLVKLVQPRQLGDQYQPVLLPLQQV